MGRKLKKMVLDNGKEVREDCGYEKLEVSDYIEGKWPIEYSVSSQNFVADMCLQVYAKHKGMCGAYVDSEKYHGYVTDCSTCFYQRDGECIWE